MIYKLNSWKARSSKACLGIMILLAIFSVLTAGAQVTIGQAATIPNTPAQDQAYCVDAGYLYRVTPGISGNRPVCQFSDYSYCDAHSFAIGNCTPTTYGLLGPYGTYSPYTYDTYPLRYLSILSIWLLWPLRHLHSLRIQQYASKYRMQRYGRFITARSRTLRRC